MYNCNIKLLSTVDSTYLFHVMQHIEMGDFVAMCFLRYRWKHSKNNTACVNKSASLKEHFFLRKLYVSFEKVNNYMIGNIISFYRIFVLCNLEVWFRNYGKSCEVPPNLFGLIH